MRRIKKKVAIMVLLAFVCLSLGLTMLYVWPSYFNSMMKKELILSPTSMTYEAWKKTPIPMYLKIYMYNWTNYDIVIKNSSIKPHFNQMGPYVFREIDTKVHKVWNDNGTVTFQNKKEWFFEPGKSNGSLTDKVTNLNPVASTITYMTRNYNNEIKRFLNVLINVMEKPTVTKEVRELLFDGFSDRILDLAVHLKRFNFSRIPFDKFAWFYTRNGSETYDGTFNMLTGSTNFNSMGTLKEWKYSEMSTVYPTCGKINGTMGDLWPPLLNNKTVSVFSPDACTSFVLKADGFRNILSLNGINFISDEDMFDNGTKVESRKCYCQDSTCPPSGALNISPCKFGAPAFISLPHFYLADKSYLSNITGMNPNKEEHEFRMVVEQNTGVPLQVRATLQINFLSDPDSYYSIFNKLPKMYVPMLWFKQEANITSEFVNKIKLITYVPIISYGVFYSVIGIGLILFIVAITIYVRQRIREDQMKLLENEQDNRDKDDDDGVDNEVVEN